MSKTSKEFEVGDIFDPAFENETAQAKVDTLEAVAYSVKEEGYTKILNEVEITQRREELSDICIEINDIEEEKKEVVSTFKERLKLPKEDRSALLASIKHKSEFKRGHLYYVDDQENGFMYIFDTKGECIESRKLKPNEKQGKIKMLNADKKAS